MVLLRAGGQPLPAVGSTPAVPAKSAAAQGFFSRLVASPDVLAYNYHLLTEELARVGSIFG
jgi:hypothetical protein